MPIDKHLKHAARELGEREGISYTAARRRLAERDDVAVPPISTEAVAAVTVNQATGYDEGDGSMNARMAFDGAARLEYWEERRAGRPVRLWQAEIEIRAAASSPAEARWLLYVGYLNRPCFRVPGPFVGSLDDEVAAVGADEIEDGERRRLVAAYPRRPMPWSATWEDNAAAQRHDIAGYVEGLERAAARLRDPELDEDHDEDAGARDGLELDIYSITLTVNFLDGMNVLVARRRADELAATVVDRAGRPLGRVVSLEPDDGGRNHASGGWEHPAVWDLAGDIEALWDDHDAARSGLDAYSLPRVLTGAAKRLIEKWDAMERETAAFNERRHLHPDGSRSLATPQQLAAAVAATLAEHAGDSPEELTAAADDAEYMAARVYAKVVDTDTDEIRLEIAEARAKALRQRAGGVPRY